MVRRNKYKKYLYKHFLRLRKNIQNRPKIFKFKRHKWKNLQQFLKRDLKFFRRYRVKDQFRSFIPRFRSRGNSFQRRFRQNLRDRKIFTLYYGGVKKKYLKTHIKNIQSTYRIKNYKYHLLRVFESRLDTILYRAGFCFSIQNARQLILHGAVKVNRTTVRSKSYLTKSNDFIEVTEFGKLRSAVKKNLLRFNFWPVPPKHMAVNYKTLQIILSYPDQYSYVPIVNHYLNTASVSDNIREF